MTSLPFSPRVAAYGLFNVLLVASWSCGAADSQSDRTPASAILSRPAAMAEERPAAPLASAPRSDPPKVASVRLQPAAAAPVAPPDPKLLAQAQELVTAANKAYHAGAYDKAEMALKEAVILYPFLADANLMLGKIFLLKGSATRDLALVNSARLMFEMAHTIDPTLHEAEVLLGLFKQEPTE